MPLCLEAYPYAYELHLREFLEAFKIDNKTTSKM